MGFFFLHLPTAFLPDEDQGIISPGQLPAGATQERTQQVMDEVRDYFLENEKEAVERVITVAGFSFAGRGQNMGLAFVRLKDWNLRHRARPEGQRHCRPGHEGLFADPRRPGLRLLAAGGA